jgi:hypothetical protein
MSRLFITLAASCLVIALGACDRSRPDLGGTESTTVAAASSYADPPRDFKSIAAKVVGQSLEVRGTRSSSWWATPPISDCWKTSPSRRASAALPAKYDAQPPAASIKLAQLIDVFIATESGEGRTLRGVSPERQAARSKAFQPDSRSRRTRR